MQASANPQVNLRLADLRYIYSLISQNPALAELKKNLRQHFMHLLEPEAHAELNDIQKRVLLISLDAFYRENSTNKEIQKIIQAIKQDIAQNDILFLADIKNDEKQPLIDYIKFCDNQYEINAEQKLASYAFMQAGRAVNEENGAANKQDSRLSCLTYALHRQGVNALHNRDIRNALLLFQSAYRQALSISDTNAQMRQNYIRDIQASMLNALKGRVELLANQGELFARNRQFAKTIVAYAKAVRIAKIIYKVTNDAELLVDNQRLLVEAFIGHGDKKAALQKHDDAILYYRAALVAHRQILSKFQSEYNLNYTLLAIHINLVDCYLAKAKLLDNQTEKVKYLKYVIHAYHIAVKAHNNMPEAFRNDEQHLYRFALLKENYEEALHRLQERANHYQKLGDNYLIQQRYREALIYLIFEYYHRHMSTNELEANTEKQVALNACAVKLSETWNSLFHPKDAKTDSHKKAAPLQTFHP